MNGKDLFFGMNYVKAKYIEEAETVTELKEERKIIPFRKVMLIAAAIALLAITITACAYAIQRIQMNLVQHNVPTQTEITTMDNEQPIETPSVNVLTDCYPHSIPAGYQILCGEPLTYSSRNLQYYNENGNTITFWISTEKADEEVALRPPVEETVVSIKGCESNLRSNEGAQVLSWENTEDGYYATLFTDDVSVDLAEMANSVDFGATIPMSVWYRDGEQWEPWYPTVLPEGYTCKNVSPVAYGQQTITYENGNDGYIRYGISTLRDLAPTEISDQSYWEEVEVNGNLARIKRNRSTQRALFWHNETEDFYAFLETDDETVDLISIAENMAPGPQMEVSKSYLGPEYTIELEQEPTTYIEWQSIYPQNIPDGYELEYVGDRAYGQQNIEWKNQDGELISFTLYFRLGQYGREFEGTGEPEVVSINGHTGYRTGNSLLWTDEELGFAYDLRVTGNVDLIALAESVAPGLELPLSNNDWTIKALEQLGDYRITDLPKDMIEDGLSGSPLEDEDDWYSYVRRWYYDKTNNNQVYFTYETYSTDCNTEQEVLKLFVPAFTEAEFASIQGYPAITLQDEHRAHVAWMIGDINKGVSFQLYSEQFTVEELLKMAESVQKQ